MAEDKKNEEVGEDEEEEEVGGEVEEVLEECEEKIDGSDSKDIGNGLTSNDLSNVPEGESNNDDVDDLYSSGGSKEFEGDMSEDTSEEEYSDEDDDD